MTNLSPNFTIEEFIASDTAARWDVDNDAPLSIIPNLRRTAQGLEQVRTLLGNLPIHVNSGYRCEALEKIICTTAFIEWCTRKNIAANDQSWKLYYALKQHPSGNAVDFTCAEYGTPYQIMKTITTSSVPYDQVLLEYNAWVHISFASLPRHQALVIDNHGTRNFV